LVRSYGSTPVRERLLRFPRSVEPLRSGRYLVADTCNNRVVELDRRSRICWSFGGEAGDGHGALFWPRRALRLADQSTLIADSRNDRLLVVNTGGKVERVISSIRMKNGFSPLRDPHDIISAPNGHLFVADTGNHRLVEVDRVGRCVWLSFGPSSRRFDDPHHVSVGTNGELLISDTGNDRIVICNLHSKTVTDMQLLSTGKDDWIALKQPRACYFRYGHYWILDSGNSRIVIADRRGRVVWSSTIALENSPLPRVTCPRWLSILSPHRILMSDYFESRVLLVRISRTWLSGRLVED